MCILNRINILIPISLISILILSADLRLHLPREVFPVDLSDRIFKALLLSPVLVKCPVQLNLKDLRILTILDVRYKLL